MRRESCCFKMCHLAGAQSGPLLNECINIASAGTETIVPAEPSVPCETLFWVIPRQMSQVWRSALSNFSEKICYLLLCSRKALDVILHAKKKIFCHVRTL